MLRDSLEKILKDYEYKTQLIEFLSKYKEGYYIYPSALQENLKTTDKDTYDILMLLTDNNILELSFLLSCPYCDNELGVFNSLQELSKKDYCGDCDKDFDPFQHTIVAFRVIK